MSDLESSTTVLEQYRVDLLYFRRPVLEGQALADAVRAWRDVELTEETTDRWVLQDRETPDAGAPPRWILEQGRFTPSRKHDPVVDQSWQWRDGADVLTRCTASVRLFDDRNVQLDYKSRLESFQRVLLGVLQLSPPDAIHWLASEQLIEPSEVRESLESGHWRSPMPGPLNVRFFRVESQAADEPTFLMDTIGLYAFGLPDLQCRFRSLSPEQVGPVLYNTGCYLFENGPVLRNGHTLQGIREDDRWKCQHAESLAEPRREVVDLDPGFPYHADLPSGLGD